MVLHSSSQSSEDSAAVDSINITTEDLGMCNIYFYHVLILVYHFILCFYLCWILWYMVQLKHCQVIKRFSWRSTGKIRCLRWPWSNFHVWPTPGVFQSALRQMECGKFKGLREGHLGMKFSFAVIISRLENSTESTFGRVGWETSIFSQKHLWDAWVLV